MKAKQILGLVASDDGKGVKFTVPLSLIPLSPRI